VRVQSTRHSLINIYIHEVRRTSNNAGKLLYKEFATERYMNYNVEINCHFALRTIKSKEITGLENLFHAAKSL